MTHKCPGCEADLDVPGLPKFARPNAYATHHASCTCGAMVRFNIISGDKRWVAVAWRSNEGEWQRLDAASDFYARIGITTPVVPVQEAPEVPEASEDVG